MSKECKCEHEWRFATDISLLKNMQRCIKCFICRPCPELEFPEKIEIPGSVTLRVWNELINYLVALEEQVKKIREHLASKPWEKE